MSTTAKSHTRMHLPELLDLGKFTLLLHDESIESGEPLARQIRESIITAFAKLDPVLSLVYELEIVETDVEAGSRKSKNRVRLKRKKGKTILQKTWDIIVAGSVAIGLLTADYGKIPENLEKVCQSVVADCMIRGQNVEITDKQFPPVDPSHPAQEAEPPDEHST